MGDVILTRGGLVSQAPAAALSRATKGKIRTIRTISGGGGRQSIDRQIVEAQEAARKEAARRVVEEKAARERALVEKTRQAGLARQAAQKKLQEARRKILTRREMNSLKASEQLRITAQARGKGFTQKEGRDFLKARGGSISDLRSANRKGFAISVPTPTPIPKKVTITKPEKSREQMINELISSNKKIGVLTSRDAAARVIDSRIRVASKKTIMTGEVVKVEEPKTIVQKLTKNLSDLQKKKSTASIRKQQKDIENELKLLGLTIGTTLVAGAAAVIALPKTLVNVAKNPAQLKNIPSAIKKSGAEFGELIIISPTEAFGKIAGELIFLKGAGKSFRVVGKVSKSTANKIDPFLKRVNENKLTLKTTKGVTKLEVGVIGKGVSLRKQAKLSGKKLDVVTSVQADKIINFIKNRKRVIRKPIPGEEALNKRTKSLLEKFDNDLLNKKDFIELNKRLIKETGDKTLLERSLFADPTGKIRFTRLAKEAPEAKILDILSGDFTLKTPKPQLLVFTDIPVAKFPKALRDVANKLKKGKTITEAERIRLVEWQVKRSGKFKPIGDVRYKQGKELEVTIAPGELIKRRKKLGTTLIDGKRVEIVEAEIFKPSKALKQQINKANKGLLNKKQIKALEKKLEKSTGFKSKNVRRVKAGRPRARVPKRIPRIGKRIKKPTRVTKPVKRPTKRPTKVTRITKRPTRIVKKPTRVTKPVKRPTKRPTKVTRVSKTPKKPAKAIVAPVKLKPSKKPKKKPVESQQVFNVFGRSKGKFVKLNVKPLTRKDALSKGAFAVDRTTARTFKIEPAGKTKTPGKLLKGERNYFNRQGFKLREVKIKKGRKFQLKNKFIEKSKHAIDTKSEKKGLTIAKLLKQQRKLTPSKAKKILKDKTIRGKKLTPKQQAFFRARANIKNTPKKKRKITSTQRKELLRRLEKARKIRQKNLKGGKKK